VTIDQILEFNSAADAGLEIGQILKVPYVLRSITKIADGFVHKVEEKETLFSISQLYDVTVYELREWNSLPDNTLSVGQEIVIRRKKPVLQKPSENFALQSRGTVHTVEQGETLFSISRKYGITVEQVKDWNDLNENELKIGQRLFVSQPMMAQNTSTQTTVVVTPPAEENIAVVKVDSNKTKPIENTSTIVISESVRGDDIIENGLAELIEGTDGSRKYLALHRTAPVGTILKIKNQMNNREVFVRVVGKLPDIAQTNKIIIKISKSAYDRLGAIDPRFMVEISYSK
jgi:LysM repeat protein